MDELLVDLQVDCGLSVTLGCTFILVTDFLWWIDMILGVFMLQKCCWLVNGFWLELE